MSINPAAKTVLIVGERDIVGFEFFAPDIPTGGAITSATVAVSPASGLALDDTDALVTTDGTTCYMWVAASVAGEYDITFTVTFSDTKVKVRTYHVTVLEA